MVKFTRKARGHFVTLIEVCIHLTERISEHIAVGEISMSVVRWQIERKTSKVLKRFLETRLHARTWKRRVESHFYVASYNLTDCYSEG